MAYVSMQNKYISLELLRLERPPVSSSDQHQPVPTVPTSLLPHLHGSQAPPVTVTPPLCQRLTTPSLSLHPLNY